MTALLPILMGATGLLLFILVCFMVISWFHERALAHKPYKVMLFATCFTAFLLASFAFTNAYIIEKGVKPTTTSYIDITEVYKIDFNRYVAKGTNGKLYDIFPNTIYKGDSNHIIIHHSELKNPKMNKWVFHKEYAYTLVLEDPTNIPTSGLLKK